MLARERRAARLAGARRAHVHRRARHALTADERVGGRVHERHLVERDHVAERCGEQLLRVDHVVHRDLLLRRAERNVREQRSSLSLIHI